MSSGVDDPSVYEARYGWNAQSIFMAVAWAIFTPVFVLMWPDSPVTSALGVVLFGLGGLAYLMTVLSKKVALRVDGFGVTMPAPPLWGKRPDRAAPWAEITAVMVFQQVTRYNKMTYVGLQRRQGLPPLGGKAPNRALAGIANALVRQVPADVLVCSVGANGWSLDIHRLAEAVSRNAPNVPVLDTRR